MRKILWGMLFVLMALIFTSFTVTAQKYTSESVIDEDTGATTNFARSVELIPGERLKIDVSSESVLPWEFKVTQTDSSGKDLVTTYNCGGNEEKKIRKELTSPGHYTFELISTTGISTKSLGIDVIDYTTAINWHMSVTKYKPILTDPENFTRDPVGSLLQILNTILSDIYNYLYQILGKSVNK